MLPGWRTTASLLLLLLEAACSRAQSGDADPDAELGLSCSSHISLSRCSLTCRLLGRRGDDEDEGESIRSMRACQNSSGADKKKCFRAHGDTVSSAKLYPVNQVNVTVRLKGGGRLSSTFLLQKIVKPMSPQVWNVTSEPELHRTRVFFQIPYNKDFLTLENQLFQLDLWTKGSHVTTQNVSKQDFLQIDMQHLRKNAEYQVRVRAIPQGALQGTWSEWSPVVTFSMGSGGETPEWQMSVCAVVLSLLLLVVLLSAVVFWKHKIFTYMWPSIPHPKQTLVQICKPDKGLLLNLNPEVFSFLKVHPLEISHSEEAEPPAGSADGCRSDCRSDSTQSSDCRSTTSVSTEELEMSALLGRSSSDGEDSRRSGGPSPANTPPPGAEAQNPQRQHAGPGDGFGPKQPEEAYVTMSSFYQIK
uniref:Interleukin 7 receptor n=1 Tax=Fundulus heteroclitus TaxID=8078 RepID=A0A3Q2QE45_FUNHE